MNSPAYRPPAPTAGSAKHLSVQKSTAPVKSSKPQIQHFENREPDFDLPDEPPQKAPKKKSRWWIWVIIALLVLGAGAAAFFLLSGGDEPEPVEEEVLVYGLENPVVFENEECAFIIDAVGEKGDYLEFDVRCVNKTEDVLSFTWDSTCLNGSMFDPLWNVYVQAGATMRSSITFPLSTLNSYNLLPANQVKFVLCVHNESQYEKLLFESSQYIWDYADLPDNFRYSNYQKIEGYDYYLFDKDVQVDEDGRPYYVREERVEPTAEDDDATEATEEVETIKTNIYFDEIYDRNGRPMYPSNDDHASYLSFYHDRLGRPYYFNDYGDTVYYEGYGYAFYDETNDKFYFYDESGDPAYYGNSGMPEYYTETVTQALLDAKMPTVMDKASGCYIVHKEFTIYPTGKTASDIARPERITAKTEQIYWDGEKGNFIVLGGEKDEFKGYVIHTFVENKSDNYIYFGWDDVVVNGAGMYPSTITVLRPHSTAYRDIVITNEELKSNSIKTVSEIDFSVYAVGENLSVPLYPIQWMAPTSQNKK